MPIRWRRPAQWRGRADVDLSHGSCRALNAEGLPIQRLETTKVPFLVSSSVISGGMLPKMDACLKALSGGVGNGSSIFLGEGGRIGGSNQKRLISEQKWWWHDAGTVQKAEAAHLIPTYERYPVLLTHGRGCTCGTQMGSATPVAYLDCR